MSNQHGGKRPGAARPKIAENKKILSIRLSDEQQAFRPKLSAGLVRMIIDEWINSRGKSGE